MFTEEFKFPLTFKDPCTIINKPESIYLSTGTTAYEFLIFSTYEEYYYALHDIKYEDYTTINLNGLDELKGKPYTLGRILYHDYN